MVIGLCHGSLHRTLVRHETGHTFEVRNACDELCNAVRFVFICSLEPLADIILAVCTLHTLVSAFHIYVYMKVMLFLSERGRTRAQRWERKLEGTVAFGSAIQR